uniref:Ribonuclease A-domain domain-containing protein n=1 Tax=Pelusios castaneus TaxID=367368 RepID=A0A8C8RWJ2_9SAUR
DISLCAPALLCPSLQLGSVHNIRPEGTEPQTHARHYCNLLMPRRNLTANACKPTNTFIHAEHAEVDSICRSGGTLSTENYYDSHTAFPLTTCRLAGGAQKPPCNYRGRTSTQRIRVACVGGVPVHYKAQL